MHALRHEANASSGLRPDDYLVSESQDRAQLGSLHVNGPSHLAGRGANSKHGTSGSNSQNSTIQIKSNRVNSLGRASSTNQTGKSQQKIVEQLTGKQSHSSKRKNGSSKATHILKENNESRFQEQPGYGGGAKDGKNRNSN